MLRWYRCILAAYSSTSRSGLRLERRKHHYHLVERFQSSKSYGMPATAAFRGWKAQDAIEWFHEIGRLVVLGAFLFHFVRRILEILFVNSYSRPTPPRALVTIALLHGGAATSCAFFQVHTSGQLTSNPAFMLGVIVFGFGELLNGYHHWLLARLRPPNVRTYVVPRGGLFRWVASPHYFGEVLSFVGYAMMSGLLPVWGNAPVASAYLTSRANSTLKWYQREMPLRNPSGWRGLVPFAY